MAVTEYRVELAGQVSVPVVPDWKGPEAQVMEKEEEAGTWGVGTHHAVRAKNLAKPEQKSTYVYVWAAPLEVAPVNVPNPVPTVHVLCPAHRAVTWEEK
jgi:hypothetical protein